MLEWPFLVRSLTTRNDLSLSRIVFRQSWPNILMELFRRINIKNPNGFVYDCINIL